MNKYESLPEEDEVSRYVPWARLHKDENDNVVGLLPQAFSLRAGEDYLSVNWVEYFSRSASKRYDCIRGVKDVLGARPKSAFAFSTVGNVRATLNCNNIKVRVLYWPVSGNESHSAVKRIVEDDLVVMDSLLSDAFSDYILTKDC